MTQFQDKIRAVVRQIPKGQVLTYKQVAYAAGKPGAARAVANTMAKTTTKLSRATASFAQTALLVGITEGELIKNVVF